jgi:predicted metal-binding membrane protein
MTSETAVASTAVARGGAVAQLVANGGRSALKTVILPVLVVASLAWTYTTHMGSGAMGMSFAVFVGSWIVMMLAMMLPAVAPVVALYSLAARRNVVAAVPVFLAGYVAVWAASALPAYAVSQAVSDPLAQGRPWVARLTGATLLIAGIYQVTPLKAVCLRNCRSPLSFFLQRTGSLERPRAALQAGAGHGLYCLGCCWALMAVLVVLGGMQLGWALALAVVISVEKLAPWGTAVGRVVAVGAAGLGIALLVSPGVLTHLVSGTSMSMSM